MSSKRRTPHESDEPDEPRAPQSQPPQSQAPEAARARDAEVEGLQAELDEARNRHLRLAADFENFRKRARQEQLDTVQYATSNLAERLLPVLDDFQRVMEHVPEGVDENWIRGVRLTLQKLEEVLASVGVEPIETVGQRFDPKLHEAIGSEESNELPEDTVVSELRRGYRLHDRVLRPALVKVSRRSATA